MFLWPLSPQASGRSASLRQATMLPMHPPAHSRICATPRRLHGVVAALLALCALLLIVHTGPSLRAQTSPDPLAPVRAPAAGPQAVRAAARAAVVRIEVAGPYRLPYTTPQRIQAATGSGFLIDTPAAQAAVGVAGAAGAIVTNAHVAIRGTTYTVFFDGSTDPLPAQVLGVSECSDIALLQIDDSSHPALAWSPTSVAAGDPVYAAGYPGGVFDLVVTAGAVQSIEKDDETEWASVASVFNHSATTDPGSSGGPLLDGAGQVAGIAFAESGRYADRNYAITAAASAGIVEMLRSGDTAESIGVTAEALPRDSALPGVWVIAVDPNGAAARAGVLPGDIIRKLKGRNVGRDGTLQSYCRILRDAGGARLALELYRPDTGRVLQGELNGAALSVSGVFDAALVPTATPAPRPTLLPTPAAAELHDVSDDTGILSVRVPANWGYIQSDAQRVGTVVFSPSLVVAADARGFAAGRAAFARVWAGQRGANAEALASDFFADAATVAGCAPVITTLADATWQGEIHSFGHCPGFEGAQFLAAILEPRAAPSVIVYIDQLLPAGVPQFSLETLIAPLAATLLARVPFWEPPRASVLVEGLNVRAGPSLDDAVVTTLHNGETLPVLGKDSASCNWVYFYFTNLDGWSNAAPEYMQLDRSCDAIAVITPEEIAAFKAER